MLAFAMPAVFTRAEVEAIAALAHLELDRAEIDLFARQLGDILELRQPGAAIDTTGVPPTASVRHAPRGRARRRGARRRSIATRRWPTRPTPALDAGLFKVPRVIG